MFTHIYPHKPLRKISVIIRLTAHFTCGLILDLVICKHTKLYGHRWHQISLLRPCVNRQHMYKTPHNILPYNFTCTQEGLWLNVWSITALSLAAAREHNELHALRPQEYPSSLDETNGSLSFYNRDVKSRTVLRVATSRPRLTTTMPRTTTCSISI